MRYRLVLALLACSGIVPATFAASVIEMAGSSQGRPVSNTIEINGDRASLVIRDGDETAHVQFNAGQNTAWVIDHDQRSYIELSEEGVAQMATQLENMMAQVRSQVEQATAGMSEAQKAQLGGLIGQLGVEGDAGPRPPAVFRADGSEDQVAGMACRTGTLLVEGGPSTQLCVAPREDIGLPDADYRTLRAMVAFGAALADRISTLFPGTASMVPSFDVDSLDGLPLRVRDASGEVAVTAVRQEPRPPITLPAGYTRRANPLLGF